MMRTSPTAYGDDLAYIHDVGYGGFATDLAPELLQLLRHAGIQSGQVVDVGCGSGIWAKALTEAGYRVLGVDLSPAMIELARRRAPQAKFQVGSWAKFQFPKCRAITALGEVLCYQFNGRSRAALPGFCARAFRALVPDGMLIFDVAEVGLHRKGLSTWREGSDWACLVRVEHDDAHDQVIRQIVSFRRMNGDYRRSEETHRLQLYRGADVAHVLRRIGFRVRLRRQIGKFSMLPKRILVLARRP